ncbi:MAG: SGNH/GDSL hydrolase family protein [Proteobacteria bacterium]|nr:SGNH/GDSL hydrolase family protein [Pseudomonadota bacterium]MCP4918573.1 SGNH/GDSL hydrolase family protein [Pseudomonadota bacterium]
MTPLARRRALKLVLGLMVAGVLAELLLRVPLDDDTLALRDDAFWQQTTRMHAALHQADAELIYVPRPGASVEMDYGPAAFDAAGMREDALVPLSSAEPRIAMLGDSLVWGELVAQPDSLPARLEDELGLPVLNFGVTGYDTVQEAAWYERAVRPYAPDVVVLVFCLNDLLTMSGPFHLTATPDELAAYGAERRALDAPAPVRNETLQQVYLDELRSLPRVPAVFRHMVRWHRHNTFGGYVDEYLLAARDPARIARVGEALDRLAESVRADGADPVLVIAPAVYWWHRYPWDEIHERIGARGQAAGFTVIDPLPTWQDEWKRPDDWRFDGDNLHYNAEGNAAFASRLAELLQPVGDDL